MKNIIYTETRKDNGQVIRGVLYLPENGRAPFPLVINAHGYGSCYADLEHYGSRFSKQGLAMLLFDFCGGGMAGTSDGSMWDMSVLTEAEDLEAVLMYARSLEMIDPDRIFLMGESQGGYVSALVASRNPQYVRNLILWYPAFCIGYDAIQRCAGKPPVERYEREIPMGIRYQIDAMNTDIYAMIPEYREDVLIIHGDQDDIVNISYSERAVGLYERAELIVIPGAGHGFDGDDSLRAGQESIDFVKVHL